MEVNSPTTEEYNYKYESGKARINPVLLYWGGMHLYEIMISNIFNCRQKRCTFMWGICIHTHIYYSPTSLREDLEAIIPQ